MKIENVLKEDWIGLRSCAIIHSSISHTKLWTISKSLYRI